VVSLRDFWVSVREQQGGKYYGPHAIIFNDLINDPSLATEINDPSLATEINDPINDP